MTVYVPQNQTKLEDGKYVPRFDLSPAQEYGEIRFLLDPTAKPFLSGFADVNPSVVSDIHHGLKDFSDDDYILLIGNPVIIGMVTAIAAHYNNGNVRFLQWSKSHYFAVIGQDLFMQNES